MHSVISGIALRCVTLRRRIRRCGDVHILPSAQPMIAAKIAAAAPRNNLTQSGYGCCCHGNTVCLSGDSQAVCGRRTLSRDSWIKCRTSAVSFQYTAASSTIRPLQCVHLHAEDLHRTASTPVPIRPANFTSVLAHFPPDSINSVSPIPAELQFYTARSCKIPFPPPTVQQSITTEYGLSSHVANNSELGICIALYTEQIVSKALGYGTW